MESENESARLDAIMREMLGDDIISLVEREELVDEPCVKLSRSALKRKRREEKDKIPEIKPKEIIIKQIEILNDSDDSEDLMGDIHQEQDLIDTSQKGPLVVVFEGVKPKPSLFGSAKQKRTFMSSKMTTIAEIKSTEIPLRAPKKVIPISTADIDQDAYFI